MPDAVITVTECGYWARQGHAHQKFNKASSTVAGDFRCLTSVVLMAAVHEAGTEVCAPVHRFELDVPSEWGPRVLSALGKHQGVPLLTTAHGKYTRDEGHLPAESLGALSGG
ncbi:hypothetical protein [Leekyejoonella antrihumi]|uniref:Uncharacterized protein n=1 Tax=Leekyejoonella antrihumi TaxID=1660198 RepID=A0A563E3R3_9MICO|nr:hypothetical protein [Leekyejoonella antrihumi]TWP36841.1 hypothetical protein FGL98_08790 [Leekyejoonella antrihumi]